MGFLEYTVIAMIALQLLFTLQVLSNYRFASKKFKRKRLFRPRCVLIVPCKGLDETFDENIESFFRQEYEDYHLYFVVADREDPAYERLLRLKARHTQISQASSVKIWIAGQSDGCSQKLHNLVFAYRQIPNDAQVLVFADSDACAGPYWLSHIVYPLHQDKNGAASGYRCFIPGKNNIASIAMSAINAKICQMLGNTRFNLAWGGSMAIRVDRFRAFGLDTLWTKVLSDDLSLSAAVRQHGMKMAFVPACMIASYETTTWSKFFEFARRQFVITRIYAPGMWWVRIVQRGFFGCRIVGRTGTGDLGGSNGLSVCEFVRCLASGLLLHSVDACGVTAAFNCKAAAAGQLKAQDRSMGGHFLLLVLWMDSAAGGGSLCIRQDYHLAKYYLQTSFPDKNPNHPGLTRPVRFA